MGRRRVPSSDLCGLCRTDPLVPTLVPGQAFVLGRCSIPTNAGARGLIAAAGHRLVFLPT
jgi:hypothetical protein